MLCITRGNEIMTEDNPAREAGRAARTREERVTIPTDLFPPPDRIPLFLKRRVYQGSAGNVHPLLCTDRVSAHTLKRADEAEPLFHVLSASGTERLRQGAASDDGAPSPPTVLVFDDDPDRRNAADAHAVRGLGYAGLSRGRAAAAECKAALAADGAHLSTRTQLLDLRDALRRATLARPERRGHSETAREEGR